MSNQETDQSSHQNNQTVDLINESFTNETFLRNELDVILEEYKSVREEIISLQEFTRQNITTTYAGLGVLGAITPFVVLNNLQFVFLIFPIFFLSIALTSTKYALAGLTMGSYLKETLIPHTREILSKMNDDRNYSHIFSWEEGSGVVKKYGWFFLPANSAHYWIVLFAALISMAAYFGFPPDPAPPVFYVGLAIIVDAFLFIYTVIVGLVAGLSR
jgi:hypothetical protein